MSYPNTIEGRGTLQYCDNCSQFLFSPVDQITNATQKKKSYLTLPSFQVFISI